MKHRRMIALARSPPFIVAIIILRHKHLQQKGVNIISNIILKSGRYKESTLVDMICTEAQKRAYHKKEKFRDNKARDTFLDRLGCYCEFKQVPNTIKYDICVFKYPKTAAETKIHKGIYQYLAPLILDKVINTENGRWTLLSAQDFASCCSMMNRNYNTMKYNQRAVETDLSIPIFTVSEYFNKADNRISYYLQKCIAYLASMNCVFFDEIHIITTYETEVKDSDDGRSIEKTRRVNRHEASKDELDLVASLDEIASKTAGVRSNSDKWYGKTATRYKRTMAELYQEFKIKYVCRGFRLHRIDTDRCKEILATFSDKPISRYRQEIGMILKALLDDKAEERSQNHAYTDESYMEHFKDLSQITLPYDAPDIRPRLPSMKSYNDKLQQEADSTPVRLTEIMEGV